MWVEALHRHPSRQGDALLGVIIGADVRIASRHVVECTTAPGAVRQRLDSMSLLKMLLDVLDALELEMAAGFVGNGIVLAERARETEAVSVIVSGVVGGGTPGVSLGHGGRRAAGGTCTSKQQ